MSEAYDNLPYKKCEDIYLEDMPFADKNIDNDVESLFDNFMSYRDIVLKRLEEARNAKIIGKSFNAKLIITLDDKSKEIFNKIKDDTAQLLIVSQVEFKDGKEFNVEVLPAQGEVCSRCWMIVPSINRDELCDRCAKIIAQNK